MANQVIVTSNNTIQVSIEPTPNVEVQISRAAINAVTTVANANYANVAGTAYSVSGANVSGSVANANYANISGTAYSVAAANVSGLGNVALLNLDGNASNILYGNGIFATPISPSNVANANYANYAGNAFSVSVGNVVGIGNIATVNLNGNASTILDGTGNFVALPSTANANYANYAGNAFSVDGANVNGSVANANYANISGETYYVTGANVDGEVAYANIANISNVSYSINVANVSGIGNIATLNLDGNVSNILHGDGSFGPEAGNLNANYANYAGNLINGTTTVSIPTANGAIILSPNAISNAYVLEASGFSNINPPIATNHVLRFNTFGRNNNAAQANPISWFKARGNAATPLSVQPNDELSRMFSFGHNGTAYQGNSFALIRGVVDSSYTANTANIPIGYIISVNDTNGGVNNQTRNHTFYANGNVSFNRAIAAAGNITTSNGTFVGNSISLSNPNTSPGTVTFGNAGVEVTLDNVNTGIASFGFSTYQSGSLVNPYTFFRARGNASNPLPVQAGDAISVQGFNVYADSGNTYKGVGTIGYTVLDNDGAGNVSAKLELDVTTGGPNSYISLTANSNINLNATNVSSNGTIFANYFNGDGSNISNITAINANYANYAGNAYAVDGANVSGTVANANYATYAGEAYLVSGGNVSGQVGNALVAGTVYTNAQPNITSLGNLTSLTVNNGSNVNTYRYNPNGISIAIANGTSTFSSVTNGSNTTTGVNQAIIFSTSSASANTPAYTQGFYSLEGGNAVQMASIQIAGRGSANGANRTTPGNIYLRAWGPNSNLQAGTLNSVFTIAGDQTFLAINAPGPANTGVWGTRYFGSGVDQSEGILFTNQRNRGNNTTRTTLLANDYIGNIEWIAGGTGSATGTRLAKIAPRIDSSFGNSGTNIPIGMELIVCDASTTYTHNLYSNGNVSFASAVSANGNITSTNANLGNLATANYFSGDGSLLTNINASNVGLKYGQVSSNASQNVAGANTATYVTFNNTGLASGVSIVANSNVTISNAGKYNVQFSIQAKNPDNQDHDIEIWFDKNGNAIADSSTYLTLQKDLTTIMTVNILDNVSANDYFRIGFASTGANVFLQAIDQANTIANVSAVPSAILTVNQIG